MADGARLVHVDGSGPGLGRRDGVVIGLDGTPVEDAAVLARVRALAIPPAWRDVWISARADAHLQATGYDAAGRKQYRYHPEFRADREHLKFDDMLVFGRALPGLREHLAPRLRGTPRPGRDAVLALALRLLDRGLFRVGNDVYAREDHTYGLTTLLREHVRVDGDTLRFDFRAKHGVRRLLELSDPEAAPLLAHLRRRRSGPEQLLAWRDARGRQGWRHLHAAELNDHLRALTGGPFSAKEFRTFHATVLAAQALGRGATPATAAREVSEHLGNTPAVARASYIDPRVFTQPWPSGPLGEGDVLDALERQAAGSA